MDQPKGQAPFISDFKKNQEKQFADLSANRRVRLRSSIFDLPEFATTPLLSAVILVQSHEEVSSLQSFIEEGMSNEQLEIILMVPDGLEMPQSISDGADIHRFDLSQANLTTWMNRMAKRTKGKVICLVSLGKNFKSDLIMSIGPKIENSENNLVQILESKAELIGIAMTRDLYYLGHGMDELIEDVNVALLDLTLRVEMLGGQVEGANWPRGDIPAKAEKNIRSGRLTINQGLTTFTSDN